MEISLDALRTLVSKRRDEIEESVEGTGYKAKTVLGVATFLLDNVGDLELLSVNQRATFDRFIKPLLEKRRR